MQPRHFSWTCIILFAAASPAARAGDDKVFKQLSAADTESLLQKLKIEFKKTPGKNNDINYYDFQRGGYNVRLYWYGGKDLMVDVVFAKLTLSEVNAWNTRAKFSRACLYKDAKGEYTALESNLDLLGGVTEGAVKQFLQVFDNEIKEFAKFAGGSSSDDAIYTKVTSDKLEAILKDLKIDYKKVEIKGGIVAYDYESNNHKLRLANFGGDDLMIDAHFKKLKLEDVNQYNLKRSFIRCVAYSMNGVEYTSLESNLECVGGVSDGIIRHFIASFDEEVKLFTKYAQGK